MRPHGLFIFLLTILSLTTHALAESAPNAGFVPVIDAQTDRRDSIVDRIAFLVEQEQALSVGDVQSLIRANPDILQRSETSVLANGINSGAVWLIANVINPTDSRIVRRVSVGTGWLEQVGFFLVA